jgi:hypothetical protein
MESRDPPGFLVGLRKRSATGLVHEVDLRLIQPRRLAAAETDAFLSWLRKEVGPYGSS